MKPTSTTNGIARDGENFLLSLSAAVYSLQAIKKTAYRFADRASVLITPVSDATVTVAFSFGGRQGKHDPEEVISDFCTELLDQDLREIIQKEAGPIRNLILAQAFSRTTLTDQE